MSRFLLVLLSIATFPTLLTACNSTEYFREESAQRITAPVFLLPRIVSAPPFKLQTYERVYKEGQPAMIYIAGNGNQRISLGGDPTPVEPTGLRMAAQDPKVNVIYMGRPCQYVGDSDDCPETFWKDKKYSAEVVDAMDRALGTIKYRHKLTGFHLVGYDGGAAIAALLASRRDDVLSLRTAGGILDPRFYTNINKTEYPSGSLNPLDVAPSIAGLPQRHFVGQLDKEVPSAIAHSFEQAMGEPNCSQITLVDNATHIDGWAEQWKVLLALPVECPLTMRDQVIINPVDDAGTGYTKIYK